MGGNQTYVLTLFETGTIFCQPHMFTDEKYLLSSKILPDVTI